MGRRLPDGWRPTNPSRSPAECGFCRGRGPGCSRRAPPPGPGSERRPRPSSGTGVRPRPPTTGSPSGSLTSVRDRSRSQPDQRREQLDPAVVAADLPLASRLHLDRLESWARVSPVISTGRPSPGCCLDAGAEVDGVADHAEGEPACAADRAGDDLARVDADADLEAARPAAVDRRASSTAHWTARSACWGTCSGAPKTASTASPMNWSMCPRCRATIGTMHSKSSFRRATTSGRPPPQRRW